MFLSQRSRGHLSDPWQGVASFHVFVYGSVPPQSRGSGLGEETFVFHFSKDKADPFSAQRECGVERFSFVTFTHLSSWEFVVIKTRPVSSLPLHHP